MTPLSNDITAGVILFDRTVMDIRGAARCVWMPPDPTCDAAKAADPRRDSGRFAAEVIKRWRRR